jgi:hypothetical protein
MARCTTERDLDLVDCSDELLPTHKYAHGNGVRLCRTSGAGDAVFYHIHEPPSSGGKFFRGGFDVAKAACLKDCTAFKRTQKTNERLAQVQPLLDSAHFLVAGGVQPEEALSAAVLGHALMAKHSEHKRDELTAAPEAAAAAAQRERTAAGLLAEMLHDADDELTACSAAAKGAIANASQKLQQRGRMVSASLKETAELKEELQRALAEKEALAAMRETLLAEFSAKVEAEKRRAQDECMRTLEKSVIKPLREELARTQGELRTSQEETRVLRAKMDKITHYTNHRSEVDDRSPLSDVDMQSMNR